MTSKLKHAAPHKRANLPVAVSKPGHGFQLPNLAKRRASGLRSKQNSALGARRHIPITLPTLSCAKD